jgi:hypothetical protein
MLCPPLADLPEAHAGLTHYVAEGRERWLDGAEYARKLGRLA